jgi:tetratricopeptide (TPR) repeat protein
MLDFFRSLNFKITVLFFLIAIVVYSNSFVNPFIWDDTALVVDNHLIRDWRYLGKIFASDVTHAEDIYSRHYRPLQIIFYSGIYHLFGLNRFWYHFINIAIFCINAILVYFLIFTISRNRLASFLAALFFLSHPIYASSVTYISGLADPLMGVFLCLCLILTIRYPEYEGYKRAFLYFGALMSFILALLSKELSVVFPLILIIYDLIFDRAKLKSIRAAIVRHAPFFIIAVSYICLRLTVLRFSSFPATTARFDFYTRFLIFLNVINTYFAILTLPLNLHMSRNYFVPSSLFNVPTILSFLSLIIVALFVVYSYRRSRAIFFFCVWFFIFILAQSSLFFPINTFIAEHFLYLPALCFFFVLAVGLIRICSRKALIIITFLIVCFYSLLTFARNYEWRDPVLFYKRIIEFNPYSWMAYNNLGKIYLETGQYQDAIFQLKESLRLNNQQLYARDNLAMVYRKLGRYQESIKQYKEMLAVSPDYKIGEIHHNIAVMYQQMGDYKKAIEEYMLALEINPRLTMSNYNLAFIYFKEGLIDNMIEHIEKALNIGYIPLELPEGFRPSRKEYLDAIDFRNDSDYITYVKLGILYDKYKLFDAAESAFLLSISLEPNFADSYYNLGVLYWQRSDFIQAARLWREALKVDPSHLLAKEWLQRLKKTK